MIEAKLQSAEWIARISDVATRTTDTRRIGFSGDEVCKLLGHIKALDLQKLKLP